MRAAICAIGVAALVLAAPAAASAPTSPTKACSGGVCFTGKVSWRKSGDQVLFAVTMPIETRKSFRGACETFRMNVFRRRKCSGRRHSAYTLTLKFERSQTDLDVNFFSTTFSYRGAQLRIEQCNLPGGKSHGTCTARRPAG